MTIAVPAWARDAVTDNHSARWVATVTPVTGPSFVLPITAGTLDADADAWPRTTCRIDVGGLEYAPTSQASPLLPFGATVTLDYTLKASTGESFTFQPCPTLVVDSVETTRGGSVGLTVTASDPSLRVSTDAYAVPSSLPPADRYVAKAVAYLIRRTIPGATIVDTVNSNHYVGIGYTVDGDPWAAIEALLESVGAEVYVDAADRFVIRPVPVVTGSPADTFATGPGGTIVDVRSAVVRGYNRVLLTFRDDNGRTVIGRWADTSTGPLRVSGPYGRVTYTESRDRAITQGQADAAALSLARRVAGKVRDVELAAVGRPWVEVGDTVGVQLPTGADTLVVASYSHDLTGLRPSTYRFRTDTIGPT